MPIYLFCLFWFDIYPNQLNGSTTTPLLASASSSGGNKVVVSGSPNSHLRSDANSSTDEYLSGAVAGSSGGGVGGIVTGSAGTASGKVSFTEQASTSSTSFDNTADSQAAGIYIGDTGAHPLKHNFFSTNIKYMYIKIFYFANYITNGKGEEYMFKIYQKIYVDKT